MSRDINIFDLKDGQILLLHPTEPLSAQAYQRIVTQIRDAGRKDVLVIDGRQLEALAVVDEKLMREQGWVRISETKKGT